MNNTPQSNIVSIIIPCFNEKDSIKKIINLIHKNNKFKKEIILVDDFSTDGTREIVKKFTKSFVDKVILHKFNKGKGACIKTASKYLNGEIILIENIRFFKEETNNEQNFAKKIGKLGDIYINDAFSCSHRKQSSIYNITKFVKEIYAGPLLKKEIIAIDI